MCKKHDVEEFLFCTTHQLENLCPKCFDENHEDCKMSTMTKRNETMKFSYDCLDKREKDKNSLIDKIEERKKEMNEQIEKEFENLKTKIESDFNETLENFVKFINQESFSFKKKDDIKEIFQEKFNISFAGSNIENGISVKEIEMDNSKISKTNENSKKKNLDVNLDINLLCEGMKSLKLDYTSKTTDSLKDYHKTSWISLEFLNQDNRSFVFFDTKKHLITNLANFLLKFPFVQNVKFHKIPFDSNLMIFFIALVKSIDHLKSISCISSTQTNFNHFIGNLTSCSTLTEIEIRNANSKISTLEELQVHENVDTFCKLILNSNRFLTILIFENLNLNRDACKTIGDSIKNSCNIQRINFAKNPKIGDGYSFIFNGLKESSMTLLEINFSFCSLKNNDLQQIGNFVLKFPNIQSIFLEQD